MSTKNENAHKDLLQIVKLEEPVIVKIVSEVFNQKKFLFRSFSQRWRQIPLTRYHNLLQAAIK